MVNVEQFESAGVRTLANLFHLAQLLGVTPGELIAQVERRSEPTTPRP